MPRLAAEERRPVPCEGCFSLIGVNFTRDEECVPAPGKGYRCTNCVVRHRQCKVIPEAAHDFVRMMLQSRKELWSGRITDEDFAHWYGAAQEAVADAKVEHARSVRDAALSMAVETKAKAPATARSTPAQRGLAAPRGVVAPQSPSPAEDNPARLSYDLQQDAGGEPDGEDMDIDNMGVAATLHAILRTLIKIDRRMERLEAQM